MKTGNLQRKGIVLAGGSGSRLYPLTFGVSKQLMPVYNKPLIYYPIAALMLARIRSIAIITTPQQQASFQHLLGDGGQWGVHFEYLTQPRPDGLTQAFTLAEEFLDGAPSVLALGDNIFFGNGLPRLLQATDEDRVGATTFCYRVNDPERYGVVGFDATGRVESIVEKPVRALSNYAITGLYFCDHTAPERARQVKPSARGELEIVSLLEQYRRDGLLKVQTMGRGFAWLDTSTQESLLDAGNLVRTLEERQGLQIGCPEEISFNNGWIDRKSLSAIAERLEKSSYGDYLRRVIADSDECQ